MQKRNFQLQPYDPNNAVAALQRQLSDLEIQLDNGWKAYEQQVQQTTAIFTERSQLQDTKEAAERRAAETEAKLKQMHSELMQSEQKRNEFQSELNSLRKEQEDLLVLLADQDSKLVQYRKMLKSVGYQVSYQIGLEGGKDKTMELFLINSPTLS